MSEQINLIDDGHAAQLSREREHEVDYTPGPVVRQGLEWVKSRYSFLYSCAPEYILDPCAGAGVFGQQARAVWQHFHPRDLVGVELREEEASSARRHYTRFFVGAAQEYLQAEGSAALDLVVTNPPFSLWPDLVRLCARRASLLVLYGTISWGCSAAGAALFDEFPPTSCARVVGRVHHRGPGLNPKTGEPWGADQRDTCWWEWGGLPGRGGWRTMNLPPLTDAERRWTVKPGSEPLEGER